MFAASTVPPSATKLMFSLSEAAKAKVAPGRGHVTCSRPPLTCRAGLEAVTVLSASEVSLTTYAPVASAAPSVKVALLARAGAEATSVAASSAPGEVYSCSATAPACTVAPVDTHCTV